MPWLWITFIATFVLLVLADLFGWHRRTRHTSRRGGFITAGLYVVLAFVLAGFIHAGYENHVLGMGLSADGTSRLTGREAATQFITLTLWQVALDLDGVFVVSALFAHLRTPPEARHRVLLWGTIPALVVRSALLAAGLWVLSAPWTIHWAKYVLTGLLVLAALRMLILRQENYDPSRNWLIRVLRRFVHVADRFDGANLVTREGGRLAMSPLLIAVVLLATADVWIALDSTPAMLAVSREPFLLFASSATALLCLRSVYVALEDLRGWLRCVKIGLACILTYAAVLMALPAREHPATIWSLLLAVASVGAGSVFMLRPGAQAAAVAGVSPLGEEADHAARLALRKARQVIVLVVGLTLLVIGIIMIPAPGPGLVVVFIAMAILGNEFAWARELTAKYRAKAVRAAEESAAAARKRFRPWIMIPLLVGTGSVFVIAHYLLHIKPMGLIIAATPVLIGQCVWGWVAWGRQKPDETDTPEA
ncbi:MAG: hypothetical protein HBSAPP03_12370 [Phycisphaerae bacterium]|nr:MAG: hypothetical protein HBSAPP03_12370 [Phycisphaerae bacterium]